MITLMITLVSGTVWSSLYAPNKILTGGGLFLISMIEFSLSSFYLKGWTLFNETIIGKLMLLLSLFLLVSMMCVSYEEGLSKNSGILFFLILVLTIVLVVFFLTNLSMVLYTTFELSLIPIFMIIMGWGYQTERLLASISMVFYTLTASLPLLASLIYLSQVFGTSTISMFSTSIVFNEVVAFTLAGAFLVKTPMFLVHLWLPKAHVEAPVYGSMLLAALLLKLGTWGLYIFFLMVHNSVSLTYVMSISFVGCFVTSLACIRMLDMKLIIAYSSVAHMAMVVMMLLICNPLSEVGGLGVMLTHGYTSAPLFYLAYLQYKRSHSRCLLLNKASTSSMTSLSLCWFLVLMLNMAAPPSLNLLMELFVIINLLNHYKFLLMGLAICILAGTAYSLILYSSINQNQLSLSSSKTNLSVNEMMNVFTYLPLGLITIAISSQLL